VRLAVYVPLLLPLAVTFAARPLAGRLPPVWGTWLLAGSAVALATASSAVLGLLMLTAMVRIPLAASLGHWSLHMVRSDDPTSLPVAAAAGALLAVAATAACRALWLRGAAVYAAGRQARALPGRNKIVYTDDEAADAYTLPGWPCRIVVTAGMLDALSQPERRVLLAHERAHAAWLHYLFTSATRLAAAANPLLRPVVPAVAYTVERWADERAAALTGDRTVAAHAIARAALAATAAPPRRTGPAAALGAAAAPGSLRQHGPVPRRVAALLRPPPSPRLLLAAVVVLLVAAAGVSTLEAAHDLHALLAAAHTTAASAR
jgi:Zn-dependent protease with chaperone function